MGVKSCKTPSALKKSSKHADGDELLDPFLAKNAMTSFHCETMSLPCRQEVGAVWHSTFKSKNLQKREYQLVLCA